MSTIIDKYTLTPTTIEGKLSGALVPEQNGTSNYTKLVASSITVTTTGTYLLTAGLTVTSSPVNVTLEILRATKAISTTSITSMQTTLSPIGVDLSSGDTLTIQVTNNTNSRSVITSGCLCLSKPEAIKGYPYQGTLKVGSYLGPSPLLLSLVPATPSPEVESNLTITLTDIEIEISTSSKDRIKVDVVDATTNKSLKEITTTTVATSSTLKLTNAGVTVTTNKSIGISLSYESILPEFLVVDGGKVTIALRTT